MSDTLDNLKSLIESTYGKVGEGVKKAAVSSLGVLPQYETASMEAASQYPGNPVGGEQDAMRHILFSAMATKAFGSEKIPSALSWMNENVKGFFDTKENKDMDLNSDAIGREIGMKAKDHEDMIRLAREAISSGRAKLNTKTAPNEGESTQEMEARIAFEKQKADLDNLRRK